MTISKSSKYLLRIRISGKGKAQRVLIKRCYIKDLNSKISGEECLYVIVRIAKDVPL